MVQVGQTVRLKPNVVHVCPAGRDDNETAVVRGSLGPEIEGGFVMDRDLRGCNCWNETDLEVVDCNVA
jgi:hypothetical protein